MDDETRRIGEALDALDLGSFVGGDINVLRTVVEEVGGFVRALHPGDVVTLEFRGNRVDAIVDDAGAIQDVRRS